MGTSLTGVNISSSYLGLLKSTDSLAISTSAKRITDGAGNDLPIKLSTNQMLFNAGTASAPALSFDGNLSEGFFLPTDENIGVAIAGSEVARFLSTGLSLTSSKLTLSNDQKVRWTSDDVYIQGTTASDNIQLGVGGSTQFTFAQTTGMRLHQYGSGNITGTVTQRLGVTSAGQVVEIPIGAGALDGSGTAGKIAKFTDSDTLGDSVISESSGNIQIQGLLGVGLVPESAVQLSVNGQIGTSNNGNAGAPDFTFYGDDNTGMFRADADTLAFSTGGTERLRVNSTGLGIGTTSPASKAHVAFTADFDGLRIQNSTRGHNYLLSTAGTSAEVFSIYDLDNSNNLAQFGNSGISLYTGGTERLNINSSGDATFAGNVTINKASNPTSLQIGSSLADDPFIVFQTDGNTMSMGIDRSDSNKFVISDNATLGTNNRLTIDTSGNSTFAGDVTISGSGDKIISAISSDDDATLFLSGAGSGKDTHIVYGGDRDLFISKSSSATATSEGTPVLTLGSNSNATFAGDVTVTGGDVTLGTGASTLNSLGDILSINVDSDADGAVSANLQFKISSSEKMRLNNTGLGIGLNSFSSPLAIKSNSGSLQTSAISIQANGSTDDIIRMGEKSTNGGRLHMFDGGVEKIAFYTDGTANHISAGNLALGTSSATAKLTVEDSGADLIDMTRTGVGTYRLAISGSDAFSIFDVGANADRVIISSSGDTTFNGDIALSKDVPAIDFVDTNSDDDFRLRNNNGTFEVFDTTNTGARFQVNSDGNSIVTGSLGIGATPSEDLHITGDTPVIRLTDSDTSRDAQIVAVDGNLRFDADNNNQQSSTNISFRTDGSEIARIDATGIGIGTTTPYLPLQISQATSSTGIGSNSSYSLALTNTDTTANNLALIGFNDGGAGAGAIGFQFTDHTNNYGDLLFITRDSGGLSERLRISSAGDVALYETLQFFDDTSTPSASAFIHRPASNTLAFGTNSSERLRIDSSGNTTFAGDVTLGDTSSENRTITLQTNSEKDSVINLKEGSNLFGYSIGYYGVANDFIIKRHDNSASGTDVLTLNRDDNNATFAGQVEVALASNQIKLSTGTAGDGYLNIGHFSNGSFIGTYGDDGGAADLLRFGVHSGDVALTINTDKSATFAGNVTLENASSPTVRLKDTTNNCEVFLYAQNSNAHVGTQSNHNFIIDTNNSTAITIDTSQNVGIGTSSPSAKLEISHTDTMIRMSDSDGTNQYLELGHNNGSSTYVSRNNTSMGTHVFYTANGTSTTERLRISSTGTTTIKTDGTTQLILNRVDSSIFADNTIGTIQATADDPSAGQLGGQIQFTGGGTWSSNNYPTNIIFSNDSSGTLTERMRITSAGDVALYETLQFFDDTSTPSASAFVHRPASNTLAFGTNSSERLKIDSSGGVIFKGALADHQTNAGAFEYFSNQFKMRAYGASTGTGFLTFDTGGGGGGASSERARIDSSGNLGLGTTNATPSNGGGMCINGGSITRIDLRNSTTGDTTGDGTSLQLNGNDFTIENRESGYVAISTSLTERMRITTTGEITLSNSDGIRLSPQNSNLYSTDGALSYYGTDNAVYLNGAGANGWLRLQGSGAENNRNAINIFSSGYALADTIEFITASSTRAIIDSSGRLGLGTTSPDARFSVVTGTANSTASRIGGLEYSGTQRGLTIKTFQSNGGDDCGVEFNAGEGLSGYGSFIFKADTSERARITSGGAFLVGKTAQGLSTGGNELDSGLVRATRADAHVAEFNRLSSDGSIVNFYRQTSQVGSISVTTSATAFNTSSDYRLKEDLKDFNALDIASKIKMYDFKWKAGDSRSYGVMAHELQEVVPQAVSGDKDAEDMQQVDYSKLVPILLKSIQELEARVKELEKEI